MKDGRTCHVCKKPFRFEYARETGENGPRWFCSRACYQEHRAEQGKFFPRPKQ